MENALSRMERLSRRGLLHAAGATSLSSSAQPSKTRAEAASRSALPSGKPLRVQPVLVWEESPRRDLSSWRPYGAIQTGGEAELEQRRIRGELKALGAKAEFPVEVLPVAVLNDAQAVARVAAARNGAVLLYAASGPVSWLEAFSSSGKPVIMFLRHKSGPMYLHYEIAHFRFLRKSGQAIGEKHMDAGDIVVDDYGEVLWRLRALYGLENALGTRCLALGGLRAYTAEGQQFGPPHVRNTWRYEVISVPESEVERRIAHLRADAAAMAKVESQAKDFLDQPKLKLATGRKFVVNSFVALEVFRELMREHNAANLGVANCMGQLIRLLDTPPCLVLSILNDAGLTAFCHTDFTHTPPGVLLRWISGKPSFVCNTHFPHDGMLTLAHCAAPRRMNGSDFEPATIMTHYESDYGAATRVEFTKGKLITCLIPNFHCTRWTGFRGRIVDNPTLPACRSQIELSIEGDWRRLLEEMDGFHAVVCYGDYLPEVGYALKRTGIHWENLSRIASA